MNTDELNAADIELITTLFRLKILQCSGLFRIRLITFLNTNSYRNKSILKTEIMLIKYNIAIEIFKNSFPRIVFREHIITHYPPLSSSFTGPTIHY